MKITMQILKLKKHKSMWKEMKVKRKLYGQLRGKIWDFFSFMPVSLPLLTIEPQVLFSPVHLNGCRPSDGNWNNP